MASRKKTTGTVKAPAQSKPQQRLITNDAWLDAVLIDTKALTTKRGFPATQLLFEVEHPRLYAGRQLYLVIHPGLEKSLDADANGSMASRFPEVNFLDAESVWAALGGTTLRVHIGVEPGGRVDEVTGEVYGPRNRVISFYSPDYEPAGETA